jgi:hypothetical protein
MKITPDGYFEFANYLYVEGMVAVIENSMILGEVNMELPLYRKWYNEYAEPKNLKDNLLTWTTVFIPRLELSVIKFQCAQIDRMEPGNFLED